MSVLQRYKRLILIAHLASTLFMVGMIWTIHYVHYPLFADVGESTYVAFQSEHVNRIGKLLLLPWLIEGLTLLAVLFLTFLGQRRDLRLPAFLDGLGMAIALIISGVWSAPAHGELADGFDAAIHDRLMTANLVRSFAWTLCGICAVWIVARVWNTDVRNNKSVTQS
jgi:tryptophan-rich sensory protein